MSERTPRYVIGALIGGQGSGKDACAEVLAREEGYHVVSMSAALRNLDKPGTPIASIIDSSIKEGRLIHDTIVFRALKKAFQEAVSADHHKILINGFPRSVRQVSELPVIIGRVLQHKMPDKIKCIVLQVDIETARARIAGRVQSSLDKGEKPRLDDMDVDAVESRLRAWYEEEWKICLAIRENPRLAFQNVDATQERPQVICCVSQSLLSGNKRRVQELV